MSNCIILKKLNLLHHVATLQVGTLARDFYEAQVKYKMPNTLVSDCEEYLTQFGITNIHSYTKNAWRKVIKEKILKRNSEQL